MRKSPPPQLRAEPHKAGEYTFSGVVRSGADVTECPSGTPVSVSLAGAALNTSPPYLPLSHFEGEWYTADDTALEISKNLSILSYYHCAECLKELPDGVSPAQYSQYEVGGTRQGIQVWCKRHSINVIHMHFGGHKHVACLHAASVPAERHDDIGDSLEELSDMLHNRAGEAAEVRERALKFVQDMLDNRAVARTDYQGRVEEHVIAARTDGQLNMSILQELHSELEHVSPDDLTDRGQDELARIIRSAQELTSMLLHPDTTNDTQDGQKT